MLEFKTVRGRMVTLFGGCTAIFLVLVLSVLLMLAALGMSETINELALQNVRARSSAVSNWIEIHRANMLQLSQRNIFHLDNSTEIEAELLQLHADLHEEHEYILFADTSGNYVSSIGDRGSIAEQDYFESIVRNGREEIISNNMRSALTGDTVITFARGVYSEGSTELIGIIAVAVRLGAVTEATVNDMQFGREGLGAIIDGTGLIIAHIDPVIRNQLNVLSANNYHGLAAVGERMNRGETGAGEYQRPDGSRVHSIFAPVQGSPGWTVAYLIPDSDLNAMVNRLLRIGLILVIFTISAVIGISLWVAASVSKPIEVSVSYAEILASGDLTKAPSQKFLKRKDEIGALVHSFAELRNQLIEVAKSIYEAVDNVKTGSDQMSTSTYELSNGSEELSSTAQEMSQGSSEQAASIEEISASIEEMVANIQQSSDNALATEKIALQSVVKAEESGNAVTKTISAMKEIAAKTSIIQDIARETNMLSLNAAIEAARAGEHGKGFAVVATQVRKLAESSAVAAREIGELSSHSVQIADSAETLLDEMLPNIRRTAELVQEISAASREMSSGATQVNTAVLELDTVVQQTATASEQVASTSEEQSSQSEELSATAEELSAQARQLSEVVAYFKLASREQKVYLTGNDSGAAHAIDRATVSNSQKSSTQIPPLSVRNNKVSGITLARDNSAYLQMEDIAFEEM